MKYVCGVFVGQGCFTKGLKSTDKYPTKSWCLITWTHNVLMRHLTAPSCEHLWQPLNPQCIQKYLSVSALTIMYLPTLLNAQTTWLARTCDNDQHQLCKFPRDRASLCFLPCNFAYALGFENIMLKWQEIWRLRRFVLDWISLFHNGMHIG